MDLDEGDVLVKSFVFEDSQQPVVLPRQVHQPPVLGNAHDLSPNLGVGHEPGAILVLPARENHVHAVALGQFHETNQPLQDIMSPTAKNIHRGQVVAVTVDPGTEGHLAAWLTVQTKAPIQPGIEAYGIESPLGQTGHHLFQVMVGFTGRGHGHPVPDEHPNRELLGQMGGQGVSRARSRSWSGSPGCFPHRPDQG